jgi:anti-sigma regulatory factor (Ser/Thr protein kinase)
MKAQEGGTMQMIRIEMPPHIEMVPIVRNAIENFACMFNFDAKEAYEIKTVIDEICNNAIEHGNKGKDTNIVVECNFAMHFAEFTIKDSGSSNFNVEEALKEGQRLMEEEARKPVLDVVRRNRGLMLVKNYVDKLDIKSDPNGTVVNMVKKSSNKPKE